MHASGFEQKGVGEARGDFLDVVRDEHEGGAARLAGEGFDELQKLFAGDGVEAGARLVEDEQLRFRHEGAGDEDALAFALRELAPETFGEFSGAGEAKEFQRGAAVGGRDFHPQVELRVFAADDGFEGGLVGRHAGLKCAGHEADLEAEVAPVACAVVLAEQLDFAGARGEVAGEGFEEGGFATAVGAEDDPVFAGFHAPRDVTQQGGAVAVDGEILDVEERRRHEAGR